ncbi:High-affinity nitrate transporter 2.1 [Borealophlyctis nickersoniae]|nr:High-affinity nitrate transporter 2.1 [Borealophlyctis nickersoniae]
MKRLAIEPATGKAKSFRPWTFSAPHHVAFHLSWLGFFAAFTSWFALNPLMKATIIPDLGIPESVAASSDITNVASTIFFRLMVGVVTDRLGPRKAMALVLVCGAFPLAWFSFVDSGPGLLASRFFMGLLGAAFVPCQYWTTAFFSNKIVGTANAFAGGWGNMGGGATFLIMPHVYSAILGTGIGRSKSWRLAMLVPFFFCLLCAALAYFFGKDRPDAALPVERTKQEIINTDVGTDLTKTDSEATLTPPRTTFFGTKILPLLRDLRRPEVLILMLQYACTFGVELSVDSVLSTYFQTTFLRDGCTPKSETDLSCSILDQKMAGNLASIFGMMNLFSRASGGLMSDYFMKKFGMKGRLGVQMVVITLNGICLIWFSYAATLPMALVALIGFSLFCQQGCGTTMGIVPYLAHNGMGVATGLVGAGGTAGGAVFNSVFKAFVHEKRVGFRVMGGCVLGSAVTSLMLGVRGTYLLGKRNLTSEEDEAREKAGLRIEEVGEYRKEGL